MDFPSLPTDNLYKFLALSGLALILVSLIVPWNLINDLELKSVDAQTQIKLLEFETSILLQDVEAASKKENFSPDELAKLYERRNLLKAKQIETDGQRSRNAVLVSQIRLTVERSRTYRFIGLVLAIHGLFFWYKRVQKPADHLAKKQLGAEET